MVHFFLSLHSAHLSVPCRFRAEKRIVFCLKAMAKTNSVLNKNSVLNQNCGSRKVLEIVTGKWTVLVLYALGERPLRYADLRRGIEGISQKMLTQTLRRLQRDGLVERRSVRANSSSMQYRLTQLGISLEEFLCPLCEWAEAHLDELEAARQRTGHHPIVRTQARLEAR
jgi:DNA-binding HxlR family transcriptional regulator